MLWSVFRGRDAFVERSDIEEYDSNAVGAAASSHQTVHKTRVSVVHRRQFGANPRHRRYHHYEYCTERARHCLARPPAHSLPHDLLAHLQRLRGTTRFFFF